MGLSSEGDDMKGTETPNSRGTPGYRAPDLLREFASFTSKVDIWALGCILHELAAGRKPFLDDMAVATYASGWGSLSTFAKETERLDGNQHQNFQRVLQVLLNRNPEARPSARTLSRMIDRIGLDPEIRVDDDMFGPGSERPEGKSWNVIGLIVATSFTPDEINDHFENPSMGSSIVIWSEEPSASSDPKLEGLMRILEKSVFPPSDFGRTVALEVARTYLRDQGFRNAINLERLKDLLGAWGWLYSDEADLQIALAIVESRRGMFSMHVAG
jgi:serine/threonine protein kinase